MERRRLGGRTSPIAVRDEAGGITDSTAMLGLLAIAAVTVGITVIWLVTTAASSISLGF